MNKIKSPLAEIMEIMNIMVERLEGHSDQDSGKIESYSEDEHAKLVDGLVERGFSKEDIDTAMELVAQMTMRVDPLVKLNERECLPSGEHRGIRQLSEYEALRLNPETQQKLLNMVEKGEISSLHFEKALEYIWKSDLRNVSLSRLEIILAMTSPDAFQSTVPDRILLNSMGFH